MGNSAPTVQTMAVEVGEKFSPDHTVVHRAATHPEELVENYTDQPSKSMWDVFLRGKATGGPNAECLGARERLRDGKLGRYEWRTFAEVERLAMEVGSGLINLGLVETLEFPTEKVEGARAMKLISVFSKNCEEWILLDLAANAYGMTLVPLYDTLGDDAISFILNQTSVSVCALQSQCIKPLLKSVNLGSGKLKTLLLFQEPNDDEKAEIASAGLQYFLWHDVVAKGREKMLPVTPAPLSAVNTICYTSGTTGNPKGCLLMQSNLVASVAGARRGQMMQPEFHIYPSDVHLSYLPLPHIFERLFCSFVLAAGARIGVYGGETLKLLDDVRELRPTFFVSVPRLYNRVNDKVFAGLKEKSAVAQYLFNRGMKTKMAQLKNGTKTTHALWDTLVFNKTKALMGGRLRILVSGGAPLDPTIQARMAVLFCVPMVEGFGLTETMGCSFISHPLDPIKGHNGSPVPCGEWRLESLPDLDYRVTDDPPRGELQLHGPNITPGYFANEEETKNAFTADGWLRTGDVAAKLPNGAPKIIDRRKNIFKMSQGEYVAPEKIEGFCQQVSLVSQAFIYGHSDKTCVVAVFVPDEEMALKYLKTRDARAWEGKDPAADMKEIHAAVQFDTEFRRLLKSELDPILESVNLKGFEKPKAFYLHSEPFTVENELMTPTFKLRRHAARAYFKEQIEAMYAEAEG